MIQLAKAILLAVESGKPQTGQVQVGRVVYFFTVTPEEGDLSIEMFGYS